MKYFGQISRARKDATWKVECEPHVMMRLKRLFGKSAQQSRGHLFLSDTPENARDLMWFIVRYPMKCDDFVYLKTREMQHKALDADIARILGGDYTPRPLHLALPPREYQVLAGELAFRTRGMILGDDVGLGKTASAICLIARPETRPALVVTLTHLPRQWRAELAKFTPGLSVHVLKQGTPYDITVEKHGRQTRKVPFPDVIVTSYSKLQGWALELAKVVKTVVFDEVQELRVAETRNGEQTLKYAGAEHVARAATWRMGLSATPVYNYAGEIFNILEVLKPGALGTKTEFKREWCGDSDDPAKLKVTNPRALGTSLRDAGLMLRRTRAEVGRELPPLTIVPYEIEADLDAINEVASSATALAKIILQSGQKTRDEKLRASEELSWRLRQATGVAKAPHVAEFVKILVESGEKVVLFGWHKEVYKIWREKLKEYNPVFYTGEESASAKDKAKAAFISGESKIFIMSLRAGAGVDGLQGTCRVVVNGELDWSPMVHEQNTGRVYRDGQKESVTVYYLIADCGSDPMVSDVLGVKSIQADGVRDPNAEVIGKGQTDPDRIRKLAEDFLRQRGELPKHRPTPPAPEQPTLGGIQ